MANLINETNLDVTDARGEEEAVQAYADKLKKNCETKAPSYEERQKRRKEEMAGLRNALDILNGNSVGLIQTGLTDFLSGFNL